MREYEFLKDGWYFTREPLDGVPTAVPANWNKVSLPHTWNRYDGQDGGADYYRGKCWYVRELELAGLPPDTQVYIEFEGAASYCEVYLNGHRVAAHEGGYSGFRADLTPCLRTDGNLLSVMVSNEHQDHIYPQMADFTFYGGLYRDVNLIFVRKTHFDLEYYASEGITVSSRITGDRQALLTLHAYVANPRETDQVLFSVKREDGAEIAAVSRPAGEDTVAELKLTDLHLWQGVEDPYVYSVEALLMRHNETIDQVTVNHGFREFTVDPQRGFFLNGKLTPLRGVSRHQDRLGVGSALTFEEHLEDARLIRELGANTIRLAHYQHSQDFYDICDATGFIVWAEIPFISRMNEDPRAHENCRSQIKELVLQNYNHSSICFWGISNEITIGGSSPQLLENLRDLNSLVHELDDTRLTTMAQVSSLPMEDEQNLLTDVVSYNHYFGWYTGSLQDNEKWLDAFHAMYPDRALGISEYGCEGIITYHNDEPKSGDYSEEYQALYHEHMLRVIEDRPWLWATHIWNMFDFGCDARNEGGVAGRNNKGLVTLDRMVKKDSFYLCQAYWSRDPMVHICGRRYAKRTGDTITVKVYSNQPRVELLADGKSLGGKEGYRIFIFENVPLKDGFTTITARCGIYSDSTCFEKTDEPFAPYRLVEDESESGVTNWFDNVDLKQERELTFREGYYSINDTMAELLKSREASDILVNAVSSLTGMKLRKSMLAVMGEQKLADMVSRAPAGGEEEMKRALSFINERLQEVPRD